ncbi:protein-disulfide reductase DsbD family protein [bacterium]|nr:protein-disulfide reductase DsbD family protein [bacterium]
MNALRSSFYALLTLASPLAQGAEGLDLKLVSDLGTITPGKPFTVGLHLQHHEGFHTYWESPGIVGLPTSLKWKLPEGFKAGPIQWPFPEKSLMAGHPCHGYERDITLLVTITPPAILPEGQITLSADAQWMACAQTCHPGFENFSISFPGDPADGPKLIKKAEKQIPLPDPKLAISIQSQPDEQKITLLLPKRPDRKIYFFSSDGQISSDQPQVVIVEKNGNLLLSMTRSEISPKNLKSLPGILQLGKRFIMIEPLYPE